MTFSRRENWQDHWSQNKTLPADEEREFVSELGLDFHGVTLQWHCSDSAQVNFLQDAHPKEWLKDICGSVDFQIFWLSSQGRDSRLWQRTSAECDQTSADGRLIALQRDFLACRQDSKVFLLSEPVEGDGLHNFLRWLMPREWARRQRFLLHSSAVIDEDGGAIICLGASGAGKTTMASFVSRERVLGDDMNLLSVEEGRCYVEAAAVGQALQNTKLLGEKFPVKGFLLLKQSEDFELKKVSDSRGALALYAGLANLFLGEIPRRELVGWQESVAWISQQVPFYQLQFRRDREVWKNVFQQI